MSKLIETTGQVDKQYDEWVSMLEKLDDISVSREIFNRVITTSDISDADKDLLIAAYEYCIKLIESNKKLEINLLKIYLGEIKGYDINQIDITQLIILLNFCGIVFK